MQAGIKLNSRSQRQIQIGSNDAVACLAPLTKDQITALTASPASMQSVIAQLPKPKPGDDCVKDD